MKIEKRLRAKISTDSQKNQQRKRLLTLQELTGFPATLALTSRPKGGKFLAGRISDDKKRKNGHEF